MKRITDKQRKRDVLRTLKLRMTPAYAIQTKPNQFKSRREKSRKHRAMMERWLDEKQQQGLDFQIINHNRVHITLPKKLDFSANYEITTLYMNAIRRLGSRRAMNVYRGYKLGNVNLDYVESISTSASLVLTAELSRWDDHIANRLRASDTTKWHPEVLRQLIDVGFFNIFPGCKELTEDMTTGNESSLRVVQYIKGSSGEVEKHRVLKKSIADLVPGNNIPKWHFMATGISEAITNVGHHAYPEYSNVHDDDKNWYMGGSYDKSTNEMRIVFYDQGVSIPKSLPNSKIKEKALDALKKLTGSRTMSGLHDEALLQAAVQIDRTRTEANDRGKGLADLLNYIEQSKSGYISILSRKALYKFTYKDGSRSVKTERFRNPIEGTLIIWKVNLSDSFR